MLRPKYPNFGESKIFVKRGIVRGITLPDYVGNLKERPVLIMSDPTELPVGFQKSSVQCYGISTSMYSLLDIPIILFSNFSSQLSYICMMDLFTIDTKRDTLPNLVIQSVCPDYIYETVVRVRELMQENTAESFDTALRMVNEYRVQFMQTHRIKTFRIRITCKEYYELSYTGEATYKTCKDDENIQFVDYFDAGEDIEYTIPTNALVSPIETMEEKSDTIHSYEFNVKSPYVYVGDKEIELRKKMGVNNTFIEKNMVPILEDGIIPKVFKMVTDLSDGDLIKFMQEFDKDHSEMEFSQRCGIGWKYIVNRYIVTEFEMIRRGLDDRIVPYPFGKIQYKTQLFYNNK